MEFKELKDYFSNMLSIPTLEWLYFSKSLRIRHIKKNSFYYHQDEYFDEVGFVLKGLLYNFYTDAEGNEYVKSFQSEGMPVTCYSNLIQKTPSSFSCMALEPSTLITIKYDKLQELYKRDICWERMGRIVAENLFADKEKREFEFLTKTAKERYQSFLTNNPKINNRIPQYLIASFIGISPVSLSRIIKE